MKLYVKTMYGETLKVEIEEDSVDALKKYLQKKAEMTVRYQTLMFEGQMLVDGFKLSDYKVRDRSTIFASVNHIARPPRDLQILALGYLMNKQICRNCCGRVSPNATRCPKVKCGRTTNLRPKKPIYGNKYYNYL